MLDMGIDHRRAQISMAEDRARQGQRLTVRSSCGADRMAQRMRRDAGQLGFFDNLRPDVLGALGMAVTLVGRENVVRVIHLLDAFEQSRRRKAERADRLAGLAVVENEPVVFQIDLIPFQLGDLIAAATGQNPQPGDVERLAVDALRFQCVTGRAQACDFLKRKEACALVVGLVHHGLLAAARRLEVEKERQHQVEEDAELAARLAAGE